MGNCSSIWEEGREDISKRSFVQESYSHLFSKVILSKCGMSFAYKEFRPNYCGVEGYGCETR